MKLEVVVIPVSDVDRAKRFYGGLGWGLDADFASGDAFRVVQFTPSGSPCSIHFGKGVTTAPPGSAQRLYLIVSDIEAARADLIAHGAEMSGIVHRTGRSRSPRPASAATELRLVRSAIPTATAGCCRRSLSDCPDAWTGTRPSLRRPTSRPRSGAPRPRTASMRSAPASGMRTGPTGTPSTSSASKPASSRGRNCGMRPPPSRNRQSREVRHDRDHPVGHR